MLDWTGYEDTVPDHTKGALERYVNDRLLPGGFLTCLLSNDLFGAVCRADAYNIVALRDICEFVYNRMPPNCWGSEAKVYKYVEEAFYNSITKTQGE